MLPRSPAQGKWRRAMEHKGKHGPRFACIRFCKVQRLEPACPVQVRTKALPEVRATPVGGEHNNAGGARALHDRHRECRLLLLGICVSCFTQQLTAAMLRQLQPRRRAARPWKANCRARHGPRRRQQTQAARQDREHVAAGDQCARIDSQRHPARQPGGTARVTNALNVQWSKVTDITGDGAPEQKWPT